MDSHNINHTNIECMDPKRKKSLDLKLGTEMTE
jgi:hypothetical protein